MELREVVVGCSGRCAVALGELEERGLVERWLDELGLDTLHVAGNSLGGGIALVLGATGRARSVVAFTRAALPSLRFPHSAGSR